MELAAPLIGPKLPLTAKNILKTNFYPRYGAANDQVDPIIRVQPIQFQRVVPRYRLSTSETRDQGLGPIFDAEVLELSFTAGKKYRLESLPSWKGRNIDILA